MIFANDHEKEYHANFNLKKTRTSYSAAARAKAIGSGTALAPVGLFRGLAHGAYLKSAPMATSPMRSDTLTVGFEIFLFLIPST